MLKGKTAIITGSTSGIGLGIARGFAAQGINIVMNGFGKPEEIEKLRREIEGQGVKAHYNGADMTKPDQIAALVSEAEKTMGSVDIIVNNAGIQFVSPVDDFPPEKWDAIVGINLSAGFHMVRAAVPLMKKQGWGRIINIASAHALVASPFKSAYVAAKHGILGFTKSVALEVAQNNITCNAICPGYVWTALVEGQVKDTAKARNISEDEVIKNVLLAAQWTKKFVTVEQIAGTALFLCSDAAQNITGTSIAIDGGWTAA
ncbi:MAG: 3-hydroxybutyrate dehydrogenase [Alphaproteobacteria bacterium]|nr:3-hydroxybutyrate dehydrogenase [Alphaproteobacteria bacterium]MBP7759561.1 3-hydroxybutyrate dehydrogenase [Alphaproteobacteria bacterium]MBP7762958.1 3-hydroxybutyrate dehydrogenase [Alphaproteobacteria bacterium]MBP7904233.1 3-hydroxybutyrate dehydrogenase [Alphaproteobacteria bacterium]